MKVLQIGIAGASLVLLASCSTLGADGKNIDYGGAALQAPKLEVPPDLTEPGSDELYKVPQDVGAVATTYSGISKDRVASTVLPDVKEVRLVNNGTQHWLVVSDKAENVWRVVKEFWRATGLDISSENQAAGVMQTDWAENHAKFPQGGPHKGPRQEFSYAYAASERDQYVTRLVRKDGASTEVHITHRGIKKGSAVNSGASQWVARENSPELEAIMLQLLMTRFGSNDTQTASTVGATGAATIGTADPAGSASLRAQSGGSVVIAMNDPFDRAWRKVGLAIENSALVVEDKNRDKGIYYLRPVKIDRSWWDRMKFWKSSKDDNTHYRVNVSEKPLVGSQKNGGVVCEVSVTDQDGASSNVTKQMTEAIYKNMNQ